MEDNKNYVKKQTKVHPYINTRLEQIAKKKGISIYQMLQMVCDTLARYMDDKHNLTPEMEKAMSIFEHMEGWKKALNFADPSVKKIIGESTYFFYVPEGKRHGYRAVHVTRPLRKGKEGQGLNAIGDWQQTINIQDILERTICLLMPERYSRLRKLAVDKECSSIVELIDTLIEEHSQDEDVKFFREAFEDAERSEYGKKPWKQPFKKHPDYTNQLNLKLEDEDIRREDSSREEAAK
jgi:hypothetical protein